MVEFKKKIKSLEVDQTLLFSQNSYKKRIFSSLRVLVPADSNHQLLSPLYKSSRNQKMKRGNNGGFCTFNEFFYSLIQNYITSLRSLSISTLKCTKRFPEQSSSQDKGKTNGMQEHRTCLMLWHFWRLALPQSATIVLGAQLIQISFYSFIQWEREGRMCFIHLILNLSPTLDDGKQSSNFAGLFSLRGFLITEDWHPSIEFGIIIPK